MKDEILEIFNTSKLQAKTVVAGAITKQVAFLKKWKV